jgi:hypothetical protein
MEMEKAHIRQADLAQLCELSQPSVWAIICQDIRLQPGTLNAVTHCWPTPPANGRVLIAHLRDEIRRAGHDPETALDIRWPDGRAATTLAERDMEVLRSHMADHDVAALIHELATVLRRADRALRETSAASEPLAELDADTPGEPYTTKTKNKKDTP